MRLPLPSPEYNSSIAQQTNNTLEQEDKKNFILSRYRLILNLES